MSKKLFISSEDGNHYVAVRSRLEDALKYFKNYLKAEQDSYIIYENVHKSGGSADYAYGNPKLVPSLDREKMKDKFIKKMSGVSRIIDKYKKEGKLDENDLKILKYETTEGFLGRERRYLEKFEDNLSRAKDRTSHEKKYDEVINRQSLDKLKDEVYEILRERGL